MSDEVDFLHADKHESFLQFDFNTLDIKLLYTVILSLLMDMIKHSQRTQSNKFATSLQYQKKTFSYRQTLKFPQVGIIVLDGSAQTCPEYPK